MFCSFQKLRYEFIARGLAMSLVYGRCKTVNACALYHSFVSSSIASSGIIVCFFFCFILYGITGDRFTHEPRH